MDEAESTRLAFISAQPSECVACATLSMPVGVLGGGEPSGSRKASSARSCAVGGDASSGSAKRE